MQPGLQLLSRSEVMTLQDLFDAAFEPLNHAVSLRRLRWRHSMFDAKGCAQGVKFMLASDDPLAQTKEVICELLSIIRKYCKDTHWAGSLQIAQKAPRVSCGFCVKTVNEYPPHRPINGHKKVAMAAFIGHLGHVLHVDVDVPRLIDFGGAVFWPGFLARVGRASSPSHARASNDPALSVRH